LSPRRKVEYQIPDQFEEEKKEVTRPSRSWVSDAELESVWTWDDGGPTAKGGASGTWRSAAEEAAMAATLV
jgi:hypothetical protein